MNPQTTVQVEGDLVCAVLADPLRFPIAKSVTPTMISDPTMRAIWTVVHAHQGQISASKVYGELSTFEEGRRIAAMYSLAEFRQFWLRGQESYEIGIYVNEVRDAYVQRQIDEYIPPAGMTAAERLAEMVRHAHRLGAALDGGSDAEPTADEISAELKVESKWKVANPGMNIGWKTGDAKYDSFLRSIDGMIGNRLIVFAASSGHGKSTMLLKHALGYAQTPRDDVPGTYPQICYISGEMTKRGLLERAASNLGKVNPRALGESKDPTALQRYQQGLDDFAVLEKSKRFTILERRTNIDAIAREFTLRKMQGTIDIGFVDYIGSVSGGKGGDKASSYQMVGEIAQALQDLSVQLGIPIITAAQLNRTGYEGRPNERSIADSSKVVFTADVVQALWKPEAVCKGISGPSAGVWNSVMALTTLKTRLGRKWSDIYYYENFDFADFKLVSPGTERLLRSDEEQRRLLS